MRFAAVGDSGEGDENTSAVAQAIVHAAPDLLLALGDSAYPVGSQAQFERNFFAPYASLLRQTPVFASLGNHEYMTQNGQPYLDNFYLPANNPRATERYYSFDWGDVHFIALDSSCVLGLGSGLECTTEEQQAWLLQDLAEARDALWRIAFLHHPPWSSGSHGSHEQVRSAFASLFEAGGVELVLSGHDHDYERTTPMRGNGPAAAGTMGVTYVVVGTGGARLRPFGTPPEPWSVIRDDQSFGFLHVTIEGPTLTGRMLTPTGDVVDSFQLLKDAGSSTPEAPEPPDKPEAPVPPAEGEQASSPSAPPRTSQSCPSSCGAGSAILFGALSAAFVWHRMRQR